MYALVNGTIYTGEAILSGKAILVHQGTIHDIVAQGSIPDEIPTYDMKGNFITSGFIDLQLNGCGGVMLNDAFSLNRLHHMQATNLRYGCTSFLPTVITTTDAAMYQAIEVMMAYLQEVDNQALGLHFEGPYINPSRKGIHPVEGIRLPTQAMLKSLIKHAGVIRKITLAPEQCTPDIIRQLSNSGILVACGHSNATYLEAKTAFASGARFTTHLFNAMSPLTAREPGLLGATLDTEDIYAGVIVDGIHVAFSNVQLAYRMKPQHLILVTDATAAAGTDVKEFTFAGQTIFHQDGHCVDETGTLSGSALTLIDAIKNSVVHLGIPLDEAFRMASLYPAKVLGMDHKLGRIVAGYCANLVILNNKFEVMETILNGVRQLYPAENPL